MRRSIYRAAGVFLLCVLGLNTPALADKLTGQYLVTLLQHDGTTLPLCLAFTNTGDVSGYANSGHWSASNIDDAGGYFVVDRKELRFYGNWYFITNFLSGEANLKTGKGGWAGFSHPLAPGGSGRLTIVQGC